MQSKLASYKLFKFVDDKNPICLLTNDKFLFVDLIFFFFPPEQFQGEKELALPLSRISPHLIESTVVQEQSQQRIPLLKRNKVV